MLFALSEARHTLKPRIGQGGEGGRVDNDGGNASDA